MKSAFLQALGMAHMAMTHIRGRRTDGPAAEVSAADSERLGSEIELLSEELRIEDGRMARIPAQHRPRYAPVGRLAIFMCRSRGSKTLFGAAEHGSPRTGCSRPSRSGHLS